MKHRTSALFFNVATLPHMPLDPFISTGNLPTRASPSGSPNSSTAETPDIFPQYAAQLHSIVDAPLPLHLMPRSGTAPAHAFAPAADGPPELRRSTHDHFIGQMRHHERESLRPPPGGSTDAADPALLNALSLPHSLDSEIFYVYRPTASFADDLEASEDAAPHAGCMPILTGVSIPTDALPPL